MSNTSNDTLHCIILVPQDSGILLFYLFPLPRNYNMSPGKKMLPKSKQKKYTLKLVSKIGYSRSALEVKHNNTVFTLLCILSLNDNIMAVRLNMIRGNSKKSPATSLQTEKIRSLQLGGFTSSVVLHCPANPIQRENPLNCSLEGGNKLGSSVQWFLILQLTGFMGMLMFNQEEKNISLNESIRKWCSHVTLHWSICQDS